MVAASWWCGSRPVSAPLCDAMQQHVRERSKEISAVDAAVRVGAAVASWQFYPETHYPNTLLLVSWFLGPASPIPMSSHVAPGV